MPNNFRQPETYLPPEHRHFMFLKIFSIGPFVALFLSTIIGDNCIYNNVFKALQSTREMLDSGALPNIEVINFDKLEEVEKNWHEKTSAPDNNLNKNPFVSLPVPVKK